VNKKPHTEVCGIHWNQLNSTIHPALERTGILADSNKTKKIIKKLNNIISKE